jgi:hypothetical protein
MVQERLMQSATGCCSDYRFPAAGVYRSTLAKNATFTGLESVWISGDSENILVSLRRDNDRFLRSSMGEWALGLRGHHVAT